LEDDLAIPLHVDDYDVPSTINVYEFQFFPPFDVDHPPSPNSDVAVVDFETFLNAIDYDYPSDDFSAKS
jgi:hypothetical protein